MLIIATSAAIATKTVWQDPVGWLHISVTPQDWAKALILVALVLAILMILGDIYRGEIQNRLHRVFLINTPKTTDRDYAKGMQVPQETVPVTLDGVFSNAIFFLQYYDCTGRLRRKSLQTYRVKIKVRRARFRDSLAAQFQRDDHRLPPDETAEEDSGPVKGEIVSLAGSRADLIREQGKDAFSAELERYNQLKRSWIRRVFADTNLKLLRPPVREGLVVKFHFPINPHFMLYKHPDTNIRSTAWLTVLTSFFALIMQIIYGAGH